MQRALSVVISQKLHDPRVRGMVSVTRLDVSPDRRQARAWISVLPEQYESRTLRALEHAAKRIHRLVCDEMDTRIVPHFEFVLDRSLKKQAEVFKAINEGMQREDAEAPPKPDGADDESA